MHELSCVHPLGDTRNPRGVEIRIATKVAEMLTDLAGTPNGRLDVYGRKQ